MIRAISRRQRWKSYSRTLRIKRIAGGGCDRERKWMFRQQIQVTTSAQMWCEACSVIEVRCRQPSRLQLSLVSALWRRPASVSRFPLIRGDRLNPSRRSARRGPLYACPSRSGPSGSGRASRRPGPVILSTDRPEEALQRPVINETFSSSNSGSGWDATGIHPHLQLDRKHTTSRPDLLRAS